MPITQADLSAIRQLVSNGAFSISAHAYQRMLDRNISYDDVKDILTSPTNQIIECQPPCSTPGRVHANERILIYDPGNSTDSIVVSCPLLLPTPDIRVVTVETVDNAVWTRQNGQIPCLVRK